MRKHGDIHVVLDNDGNEVLSLYPQTREDAFIQNVMMYEPRPRPFCPVCNSYFLVYTSTNIPNCCAYREAADAYRWAVKNGEPTSADDAIRRGLDYYWKPTHGRECGHTGKTTLQGKCYECQENKAKTDIPSPRQVAMSKGEKWYMPLEPCKHCGKTELKRVDNGQCKGCMSGGVVKERDPNDIRVLQPDLIINRKNAEMMGFKFFRSGKPCCNGHVSWRYVSTGTCTECLGR